MRAALLGVGAAGALALAGCAGLGTPARPVEQASVCVDQTVSVYFDPDSDVVTPEGRAVIRQAALVARSCNVGRVQVLGLADAAGAPQPNLQLSARRAQAVSAALGEAGLPPAEFEMAAAGQDGAVTPAGAVAPVRRRVDIVLALSPAR